MARRSISGPAISPARNWRSTLRGGRGTRAVPQNRDDLFVHAGPGGVVRAPGLETARPVRLAGTAGPDHEQAPPGAMKRYMVMEHFAPEMKSKVYERFHQKGRMLPEGLTYIDSWLEKDG